MTVEVGDRGSGQTAGVCGTPGSLARTRSRGPGSKLVVTS